MFGGHPERSDKNGTVALPASVGAFTSVFYVLKITDCKMEIYAVIYTSF